MDSLNDVEMDLAISILKQQNTSFFIKPSVFQGSQELPLNVVNCKNRIIKTSVKKKKKEIRERYCIQELLMRITSTKKSA